METFVKIIHITTSIFIVLVVLIQSGKGAEISTTLGGSSQTIFGSSGGANFFTRLTWGLVAVFMCTSVSLTLFNQQTHKSLFEGTPESSPVPSTEVSPSASVTPLATPSKSSSSSSEEQKK